MGEAVYSLEPRFDHGVEMVVHVDESLGEERRGELSIELEQIEGVHSAEFCPLRYHLMLVNYDRERMSSQEVLGKITSKGVHAELIGPV